MTKTCSACKQPKLRTEFPKHSRTVDGLLGRCRTCHKAWIKAYRAIPENRERLRATQRKWAAANSEKKKDYYRTWMAKHAEREKARGRARYRRDKAGYRDRYLRRTYKISQTEYQEMLDAQSGGCAICGAPEPHGNGSFHVDHCHHSKKIRGLLCNGCNRGIGYLGDSVERLQLAIRYLARHQSRQTVSA